MNSKEALELAILEYEKYLETDENNQWVKNVLKGLKETKQDLDRLEQLEKENQELVVNKNVAQGIAIKLKEENAKLKQAFEILKDKNVDIYEFLESKNVVDYNNLTWSTYDFCGDELTEEEYKLLKEVLGNEPR